MRIGVDLNEWAGSAIPAPAVRKIAYDLWGIVGG